uniref:Uncharacterized protein n=1 Tax=Arundo donax TaxID=35708 RepID=A0A0A8YY33_ARUDO
MQQMSISKMSRTKSLLMLEPSLKSMAYAYLM